MLLKLTTFVLTVFLAQGQPAVPQAQGTQPEFKIACQITAADGNVMQAPQVTVFAGQSAEILSQTQTPFVTGLQEQNGVTQPVIEVLSEGVAIELIARSTNDGQIFLAVKASQSEITDVSEVRLTGNGRLADGTSIENTVQAPALETQTLRTGRILKDGGKTQLQFADGSKLEFTVSKVK